MLIRRGATIVAFLLLTVPALAGWKGQTTYRGTPNLMLTSEMVAAGGGPAHFRSKTLVAAMAGDKTPATLAYLTKRYGSSEVDAFFRTFTFAVNDSLRLATSKGIALPAPEKHLRGAALTNQLFRAGVMPNGQYDVGYMLERLVSHPIHMWVMWDINKQPDLGKGPDETFHIVLTDAMHTLSHR